MDCPTPLLTWLAFAINLIALVLAAVVSIVLWRQGHKDRLIYVMVLLPIALAGTCATLSGLSRCFNAP